MDIVKFKSTYEKKKVVENTNQVSPNPLVSVCVQTYQQVNYIKDCLEGILSQKTNFDIEILLGEDDSSDGTRKICIEYANTYPDKIRLYLHHRENNIKIGGHPTGRFIFLYNLLNAKGKYVAFCEGDDYWTDPLKLQKQVDFLKNNPTYAVHCTNAVILKEDKKNKDEIKSQSFNGLDILKNNFTFTASLCVRKSEIFIPHFFDKSPAGDWLLLLYTLREKKGFISNDATCVYRIHEGGIWSQQQRENESAVKKRFNNLKANSLIYHYVSKDVSFNKRIRTLAQKKQESYIYQAKRMSILYSFLKYSDNELKPKRLLSLLKLLFIKFKKRIK